MNALTTISLSVCQSTEFDLSGNQFGIIPLVHSSKKTMSMLASSKTNNEEERHSREESKAELPQARAQARADYIEALDLITQCGSMKMHDGVNVVLRDSDHHLKGRNLLAFRSDSTECVVDSLQTNLGVCHAAILQTRDLVSLSVTVKKRKQ